MAERPSDPAAARADIDLRPAPLSPPDRLAAALDALDGLEELVLLGHPDGLHDVRATGLAALLRLIGDEAREAQAGFDLARA